MTHVQRIAICATIVSSGLAAQAALEGISQPERPKLRRPLNSLPMEIGEWIGVDCPVDPETVRQAQTTEYLSREYESRTRPGLKVNLWVNFSIMGTNLRHTPEKCLPSGGWEKIEAQTRVFELPAGDGRPVPISRLGYRKGELVKHVGFWYYIFGEGRLENYVRKLPITSQSSHGRATRGSSMTIEVFYPGEQDPDGAAFREFARELMRELDPIIPVPRAAYHLP
jgi:EpsI family protein